MQAEAAPPRAFLVQGVETGSEQGGIEEEEKERARGRKAGG